MSQPLCFFGNQELVFSTNGRSIVDITRDVQKSIHKTGCQDGACNLFIKHTSASLIVCENADPTVRSDLESFVLKTFCPDEQEYFQHTEEGIDDMPAHIRSVFTQTSLSIPVSGGKLALGTWQGVFLWEHRLKPHTRKINLSVLGTT